MKNGFAGFSPEAIKFLRALKKNNDREWFQPRKEQFEALWKTPMTELVAALHREVENTAPEYVQDPSRAVFRIYRDTRFSKNKTPYKTHVAAVLRRRGLSKDGSAQFYFHVSPEEVTVAAGVYAPSPEELRALRNFLVEHFEQFQKLRGNAKVKTLLGELKGDRLTRPPKGFPVNHPASDLLRNKQFYFHVDLPASVATSAELFGELLSRFRAALPLLQFFNEPMAGLGKASEDRFLRDMS